MRWILVFLSFPCFAQSRGLGAFAGLMGGNAGAPPVPMLIYGGYAVPAKTGESSVTQHRFQASAPLSQGERDNYSVALSGGAFDFGAPVVFPTGLELSEEFRRVDLGGVFFRKVDEDRTLTVRASIGGASDELFKEFKDTTFSGSVAYSMPGTERSHWIVSVFISNNNPLANYVPIPGFIYFYRQGSFIGMFGLPFGSVIWAPRPPWAFALSLFGPTVNAEASYGAREGLQGFLGFNWSQQTFLRREREKEKDRVYVDEKKAFVGLRGPLFVKLHSELQLGPVFDREVWEGARFGKRRSGTVRLDDAWFAAWNFRLTF
ncbi:MAG TPA: hypothetical protein PKC28_02030 [Bdellovibrionales bacterium]|nr:hypothetical protein [Bdellovibrionales bacterium]